MDVQTLLALVPSAQGIKVDKSMIPDSHAGLGLFASWKIGRGDVAGHYYGFLICGYLTT